MVNQSINDVESPHIHSVEWCPELVEGQHPNQKPNKMQKHFFFYILKCSDKSYYIGTTADLKSREKAHNEGRGASYTRIRRPVQLVYHEKFEIFEDAVRRERQVKKWSRAKKEALINNDLNSLTTLSKSK